MSWEPELEELARRTAHARALGGPEKVARQRAGGRGTVRERIDALLDPGSFREVGSLAGTAEYGPDGELASLRPGNVVLGAGRVEGRRVVVCGDDFTIRGGAADAAVMGKQVHAERMANSMRVPLIRLIEGTGGGGSVRMLEQHGHTYVPANPGWDLVVDNLSLVPVAAACLGPVAGLGAARAVAAHLNVMVEGTAQLFTAGPPVVRHALGVDVDKEALGGASVHRGSTAVDLIVGSEAEALGAVRRFLGFLPSSVFALPPVAPGQDPEDPADRRDGRLLDAIPRNRRQPYRVGTLLDGIFDRDSVFRHCRYGGTTVTALARLDGHPVGVLANDPHAGGGGLTAAGADAMMRLVDLCDTFHLPLVVLTDQPGVVVGVDAERRGTLRVAARAIAAVYQARVPAAEVIVRRVFGVGGAGMTNRHAHVARWAWPSGDWGSLPVEGGIEAAYRAELEAAADPVGMRAEIERRLDAVRSPFRTAERFGVEEIIDPRDTRPLLCEWVRDAYAVLPELLGRPARGTRP